MKWHLMVFIPVLAVTVSCGQEDYEDRLEREAREFTQRFCPKRLENHVILDSIAYDKKTRSRIDYHTVSGMIDDSAVMKQSEETFRQKAVEGIRKSVEMKNLKDKGVNFVYKFRSEKSRKELLSVTVTPDDYAD